MVFLQPPFQFIPQMLGRIKIRWIRRPRQCWTSIADQPIHTCKTWNFLFNWNPLSIELSSFKFQLSTLRVPRKRDQWASDQMTVSQKSRGFCSISIAHFKRSPLLTYGFFLAKRPYSPISCARFRIVGVLCDIPNSCSTSARTFPGDIRRSFLSMRWINRSLVAVVSVFALGRTNSRYTLCAIVLVNDSAYRFPWQHCLRRDFSLGISTLKMLDDECTEVVTVLLLLSRHYWTRIPLSTRSWPFMVTTTVGENVLVHSASQSFLMIGVALALGIWANNFLVHFFETCSM